MPWLYLLGVVFSRVCTAQHEPGQPIDIAPTATTNTLTVIGAGNPGNLSVLATTNTLAMFTGPGSVGDSPLVYNGTTLLTTAKGMGAESLSVNATPATGAGDVEMSQLNASAGNLGIGPHIRIIGSTGELDTDGHISAASATLNGTPPSGAGDLEATTINVFGSTTPLTMTAATTNNLVWKFILSSAAIFDVDPTDPLGTQNADFRLYRHTATTGTACLQLMIPNTSSARDTFCSAQTAGLAFNTLNNGMNMSVGNTTGTNAVIFENGSAGQTSALPELDVGSVAVSYDTTAGAIDAPSIAGEGHCTRSAGTNRVLCPALELDSTTATPNVSGYALHSKRGFVATAQSLADESTTATLTNGTCASATCGNSWGRVAATGASVTIAFSTGYVVAATGATGSTAIPSCDAHVEGPGGGAIVLDITPTTAQLVVANAALSGTTFSYRCGGF